MVLQCDAGSRKSPIFILEKGIIMDISSILWGFIASYLAGSLPSLREFISTKDKTTLDERIEQCYQTALGRWCANDAVRQRIAQKHFNDLKQVKKLYLTEKWEKEGVILSSLANLWIEELSKDEVVSYYITTQGIILKGTDFTALYRGKNNYRLHEEVSVRIVKYDDDNMWFVVE